MPNKRSKRRNAREKYQYARQVLGLPRSSPDGLDANHVRNWSWDRILATFTERQPEERRQSVEFLNRRLKTPTKRSQYWQKYHLLKNAGYDYKTARSLAKNSTEFVQAAIERSQYVKEYVWEYQPFDRSYTQDYVYKIEYQEIDENTGEIETRWITILSHRELTRDEVETWVFNRAARKYKNQPLGTIDTWNLLPMRVGITGEN